MCGRFSLLTNVKALIDRFQVKEAQFRPGPNYNVAPSQSVAVVVERDVRSLVSMRWGLIPRWAKDPKIGDKLINARAETVTIKNVFKPALVKRRCLILADGFYEWEKVDNTKHPMHIRLKSREPFALAGLYETWVSPTEKEVLSCTIVTTSANEIMARIHDRMPVILPPHLEEPWLNVDTDALEVLGQVLKPFPSSLMEAFEVSTYVNSPRNNGPECIRPVSHDAVF
jgi:putative SOS response-associated peptidase YedK